MTNSGVYNGSFGGPLWVGTPNPHHPLPVYVWVVKTPEGRLLGVYTSNTGAWEAIASAYRTRDHYRQFELTPERVALDTWLGD
jgi:hypothetical protein